MLRLRTTSGSPRVGRVLVGLLVVLALAQTGCSLRRLAVNQVGNALAAGGATFAADDDPELIRDAAPFSLKLMESLLAESPGHRGLLFATSSGFTQYAYAFVQQEADELEGEDYAQATALRDRAKKLYLRACRYGLRGLEATHPGFTNQLFVSPRAAVRVTRRSEVPLLYWTAVSWAAAISLAKDDANLVAQIPQMEALIDRALELNEAFGEGAIHSFLIGYELSRSGAAGDPAERARRHFDRAVELSGAQAVSPFLNFAETVCVEKQDVRQFEQMLQRALAIDPEVNPESRLVNTVLQRRARWLLAKKEDLFLLPENSSENSN